MVDAMGHVVCTNLITGWLHVRTPDGRYVLFVEDEATVAEIEELQQLLGSGGGGRKSDEPVD